MAGKKGREKRERMGQERSGLYYFRHWGARGELRAREGAGRVSPPFSYSWICRKYVMWTVAEAMCCCCLCLVNQNCTRNSWILEGNCCPGTTECDDWQLPWVTWSCDVIDKYRT